MLVVAGDYVVWCRRSLQNGVYVATWISASLETPTRALEKRRIHIKLLGTITLFHHLVEAVLDIDTFRGCI